MDAFRGADFLVTFIGGKTRSQITTKTTPTAREANSEIATHSHTTGTPSAVASAAPPRPGMATPAAIASELKARLRFS